MAISEERAAAEREVRLLWDALAEVYQRFAPRYKGGRRVPARRLARMSMGDIDRTWDFDDRHLAHRIAIVLYPDKPTGA